MTQPEKKRSSRRRWALFAAAALLVLVTAVVVVLRVRFNGPPLAKTVERVLNDTIRGRVEIESIEWSLSSLPKLATGGWVPITIRGLTVYDDGGSKDGEVPDEQREMVLKIEKISGKIDIHALMFGHHDFVLDDVVATGESFALIKAVPEPYPVYEYDTTVASIVSAFYPRLQPSIRVGLTASSSPILDLRNFRIEGATIEFLVPGAHLMTYDVSGTGFYYFDASDPLSYKMYYSLFNPRASYGVLRVGDIEKRWEKLTVAERQIATLYEIPLKDIDVHQFSQLPKEWPRDPIAHDIDWDVTAHALSGAVIKTFGGFRDYWLGYYGGDYDIALRVDDAGALAASLTDDVASGEDLRLAVDVTGPSLVPKVAVELHGLDLAVPVSDDAPPLKLSLAHAKAAFDFATEAGSLEDTIAQGAGGEVELAADFGLDPLHFDVDLNITRKFQLGRYLPREVSRLAGGSGLSGRLHVTGTAEAQEMDKLDLQLGRARLTGNLVRDQGATVHAKRLEVRIGKTSVFAKGVIEALAQRMKLGVRVTSDDLPFWLRKFDLPAVATSLDGTARVSGAFDNPKVEDVEVSFFGVPVVGELETELSYRDEVLSIDRAESVGLGGTLSGTGKLRLGPRVRVQGARLAARNVDMSKLTLGPWLSGRASLTAKVSGPVDKLAVTVDDAAFSDVVIAGDPYDNVSLSVSTDEAGTRALALVLPRRDRGAIRLDASLTTDNQIGGELGIQGVHLEDLSLLTELGADGVIGGVLDTVLELGGTPRAPTASGTLAWRAGWYKRALLGPAVWKVERRDDGRIGFSGSLLQGTLRMEGSIQTQAPYAAEVKLAMHRLEVERFIEGPAGLRGWVSGTVEIQTALAPPPGHRPRVSAVLTELVAAIDNEDSEGRPAPLRLRNKPSIPIEIEYDGHTATLVKPVTVLGPGGDEFVLSGKGSADALAIALHGDITVKLLEPYLREHFDEMGGKVDVDVAVSGSIADPQVQVRARVAEPVWVRPLNQHAKVSIAENGAIQLDNNTFGITGVTITMADELTGDSAALDVKGAVGLDEFVPVAWAIEIHGQLAGKMLLVAAPELFSQASGMASVDMQLLLPPPPKTATTAQATEIRWPTVDGTIEFTPPQDGDRRGQALTLTPRGLRREIAFTAGEIAFTDRIIELSRVSAWIDEEGFFTVSRGRVDLRDWEPVAADVTLSADSLPFRIPQTLDLTLTIPRLRIYGDDLRVDSRTSNLTAEGRIEVVDGRYSRDFNLISDALQPQRSTETSEPFYEGIPLLANARLDLALDARAFFVQNNLANIRLSGGVTVTGTVADPKFDGNVEVQQGEFKIPGVRAKFTETQGSVAFSKYSNFPSDTPKLDLRSESDYRDPSGQDHLVTLIVKGTIESLNWDLYTSTGLNKAQTLTMLLSGRTPEEFRKIVGDDALGRDPNRVDPSTNPTESFTDEILKDLAGDFISLLLEDKLRNLTTLDVARLEISTGSIGFHGEKELFKNLRFLGDLEQTLRGRTLDVRGQLRLSDDLSLEGEYLNKDFTDDAEDDIDDARFRMVYRLLIP